MEAATLRTPHPTTSPRPVRVRVEEDWDWVYDDPDLAPFRASTRKARPETPLTAFA